MVAKTSFAPAERERCPHPHCAAGQIWLRCRACAGSGESAGDVARPCSACRGVGAFDGGPCDVCAGTGAVSVALASIYTASLNFRRAIERPSERRALLPGTPARWTGRSRDFPGVPGATMAQWWDERVLLRSYVAAARGRPGEAYRLATGRDAVAIVAIVELVDRSGAVLTRLYGCRWGAQTMAEMALASVLSDCWDASVYELADTISGLVPGEPWRLDRVEVTS